LSRPVLPSFETAAKIIKLRKSVNVPSADAWQRGSDYLCKPVKEYLKFIDMQAIFFF